MQRTKRAFTLVELLVVITIIGILIALLIPAVNMVREEARQTACLNNQQQLGIAILSYESSKRQLPGALNQISGGAQYTWAEAIFPNLDRGDLWDKVRTNQVSAIQTMRLGVMNCPDDPLLIDPTSASVQALLSYGVNDQFFVSYLSAPPVDRNGAKVAPAVLSNLKTRSRQSVTTTQTVMLGDRSFNDSAGNRGGKWTDISWTSLAFPWPGSSTAISPGIMCSCHGSTVTQIGNSSSKTAGYVVVITYFDGHSAKVPSDTQFP